MQVHGLTLAMAYYFGGCGLELLAMFPKFGCSHLIFSSFHRLKKEQVLSLFLEIDLMFILNCTISFFK